jgi:hypothetical protein
MEAIAGASQPSPAIIAQPSSYGDRKMVVSPEHPQCHCDARRSRYGKVWAGMSRHMHAGKFM